MHGLSVLHNEGTWISQGREANCLLSNMLTPAGQTSAQEHKCHCSFGISDTDCSPLPLDQSGNLTPILGCWLYGSPITPGWEQGLVRNYATIWEWLQKEWSSTFQRGMGNIGERSSCPLAPEMRPALFPKGMAQPTHKHSLLSNVKCPRPHDVKIVLKPNFEWSSGLTCPIFTTTWPGSQVCFLLFV